MASLKIPVTSADHSLGPSDAPLTLVEYGDYECPHCRAAQPVVQFVRAHFDDRLRFVFRNFPITSAHPQALRAAEVAEFAGTHGKFWEMHDLIYANQDWLGDALYLELVERLGLPAPELARALEAGLYLERIRGDFNGGVRSGVNGTPAFFINGVRHDGSYAEPDLIEAIDASVAALR